MTGETNPKLHELQKMLSDLDKIREESREIDLLRQELDLAMQAEENVSNFKKRLADIYADPNPIFEKFAQIAMGQNPSAAYENLVSDPTAGGGLKGWSIGPLANPVRQAILKLSLPTAARIGLDGFTAHLKCGGGSYRREDLAARVQRKKEVLEEKEKKSGVSGKRIDTELAVAEFAKEISFRDLASLPKDQYRTVEILRDKYRTLIQNREADPASKKPKQNKK